MADSQQLDLLLSGVDGWNRWRKEHPEIVPDLSDADLGKADLRQARLENTKLIRAHLEEADLLNAHLEGADLSYAHLEAANLRLAFFDSATNLGRITLGTDKLGFVYLVDVHWGGVNLSLVDWSTVNMLGEEREARQKTIGKSHITQQERKAEKKAKLDRYRWAVRANRQLAVVLRNQGMNEEADYFSYRAQVLQRTVWYWRQKPLKFVLSYFLDVIAGYGYKPIRSLIIYLIMILTFTEIYYTLGSSGKLNLSFLGALVFSVTSFHGRGFFPGPGTTSLDNPIIALAALEAILGLLIEVSFIATFTQRFFGR